MLFMSTFTVTTYWVCVWPERPWAIPSVEVGTTKPRATHAVRNQGETRRWKLQYFKLRLHELVNFSNTIV